MLLIIKLTLKKNMKIGIVKQYLFISNRYVFNTYQSVLAYGVLVLRMYWILKTANPGCFLAEYIRQYIQQYMPNTEDQYKHKYRPIQAPIQKNTHNIIFNTCISTRQCRYWYCRFVVSNQEPPSSTAHAASTAQYIQIHTNAYQYLHRSSASVLHTNTY